MKKKSHEEIKLQKPSIEDVQQKDRTPVIAILDNVRSLHNVGAIFRTADGVMLEKLYLCGITGTPPRKEIAKTALGAEELVPWEYHEDAVDLIKKLKSEGVMIIAVELVHGSKKYADYSYTFPVCFIFGHEVEGISDEVMELVDDSVEIPMLGRANSLNVATSFGIIVYNALEKLK